MSAERPLSSLELTVLGILSKKGPCRAHAAVKEFAGSQTFAYRSGAGSIYPLLARLEKLGLVACSDRLYSLTPEGWAALKAWVRPPFPESDLSTNLDLLRSRAYFLRHLSAEEVDEFVKAATNGLQSVLASAQRTLREYQEVGDEHSAVAMQGAILETMARLQWLESVAQAFGTPAE